MIYDDYFEIHIASYRKVKDLKFEIESRLNIKV